MTVRGNRERLGKGDSRWKENCEEILDVILVITRELNDCSRILIVS